MTLPFPLCSFECVQFFLSAKILYKKYGIYSEIEQRKKYKFPLFWIIAGIFSAVIVIEIVSEQPAWA